VRLAWLSPLPPTPSGIADYSADLLPLVAERAEVDVFCPPGGSEIPGVTVLAPSELEGRVGSYDAVFHHLGNNPFHEFVYRAALRWPGIAVLHDFVLHHLIDELAFGGRREDVRWHREVLSGEYGEIGARLSHLRARGVYTEFEKFLFPLNGQVAGSSRAVVVHSEYVRDRVRDAAPGTPVFVIPHHAQPAPAAVAGVTGPEARARLGLPQEAFLVGHFGFITRPKQPGAVLAGFARLAAERPDARLLVVGANQTGSPGLVRFARRLAIAKKVRFTGYVDLTRFYLYLKAVDAVVNLRYPSAGETSGTFARALGEGKATVVNNMGSFAEIPDDVALKVEIDEDQAEAVAGHLIRLAEDPGLRARLGERALAYAATELDPGRCRDLYLSVAAGLVSTTA
jgi:glycosyltransferase involved in cell wall biosynthesis